MFKIINLIKHYWHYILILIVSIYLILKLIKNEKIKSDNTELQSEKLLNNLSVSQSQRNSLKQITINIAQNLGTIYPWYDPRHWTENDKKVFELVNTLSSSEFNVVSELYFNVYVKGNNLRTDLAKLLDNKYFAQLNNLD